MGPWLGQVDAAALRWAGRLTEGRALIGETDLGVLRERELTLLAASGSGSCSRPST